MDGLLLAIVIAVMTALGMQCSPQAAKPPVPITCQEDDPCWDCETMGNKDCGPELEGGQEP